MTASTRRIRYIGRDQDTPRTAERLHPMQMTPARRSLARAISDAIVSGVAIAAAVLVVSMIWRVALSWSAGL